MHVSDLYTPIDYQQAQYQYGASSDLAPHRIARHRIDWWMSAPRIPYWTAADKKTARILLAIHCGSRLQFRYLGGSRPGSKRSVTPAKLFVTSANSPVYLEAWCHKRKAHRTFRLDRIRKLNPNVS